MNPFNAIGLIFKNHNLWAFCGLNKKIASFEYLAMKILLIEDEPSVSAFIKKGLNENGYEVSQAFDGKTGLKLASENVYALIILDIILPDMNGLEICTLLRKELDYAPPVLMLTALNSTEDVVAGLDAGADDYLKKPFKFKELLARIRALSRRNNTSQAHKVLTVNDLQMDLDAKTVSRGDQEIKLTSREFTLLEFFIKHKGKVVSRVDILENVWEINFDTGTNVIDVYVNYLRNKIDKPFDQKLIHTVVGMGYILKEQ